MLLLKKGGMVMKRRFYQMAAICLLFIIGGLSNINTARAASANIEITMDKDQVVVGDTIHVYINISSDTMFGNLEANLTYDDDILEYKSGVSFITGSSGFLKIDDMNFSEGANNRKYVLEFQALKVGKCEIAFNGSIMVYDYESGFPMSVSSNSLELEVKPAQTASDNAHLKSLKISPASLSPSFEKNILEYSTSVGYDTEKLVVVALPEDDKATIRIKGNDLLKEGENKVIVSVIAESGKVIEYTIDVLRESAPEEGLDIEPIVPDEKHGSFEVIRDDNELFVIYQGKYKLVSPPVDAKIPSGYSKTRTIISGISIEVYAPEQLDSEFLLIYAENELGHAGFYRYDKVEKTMQRYVSEQTPVESPVNVIDEDMDKTKDYRSSLNKAAIVIALLSALCAIFMIISIRLFIKSRGYKE